jgi:hypothetical protein
MNEQTLYSILFLAIMVGCVLFGRHTARQETLPARTEVAYRTDTLTIRDTITINNPILVTKTIRDSIYIQIHDTVYISLPREVRIYEDERFRAEVSGYQPSLDWIDIFTGTKIVTQTVTEKRRPHSISVGMEANYSTDFRMPIQLEYGYRLKDWITIYGYAEYELFTRQIGVGTGLSIGLEF